MFAIQELPREGFHQRLVSESFFPDGQAVVTIVASLSFNDVEDPDRVTEWRAYWMAFGGQAFDELDPKLGWMPMRINTCATRGTKLPEEIARAIFPHVDGFYNY